MQRADSTARTTRPSPEAILRALERLTQHEKQRRAPASSGSSPRASGFYAVVVDEFAGLERLDREELDEEA